MFTGCGDKGIEHGSETAHTNDLLLSELRGQGLSAGFDHVEGIVALCFAYIRLIQAQGGVSEAAFQQYRDLAQLRFNFAGAALQPKFQPLNRAAARDDHAC